MSDSTPSDPPRREIANQVVQLTTLAVTTDIISDIDFVNCEIVGPAVVSPFDLDLVDSGFSGPDPRSLVVEVEAGKPVLVGSIVVQRCSFTGCRFRRVGFAGTKQFIDLFLQGLSSERTAPVSA